MEEITVVLLNICLLHSLHLIRGHTDTIYLIHAVSRHGDRTPVDTYPNDPHLNETFLPFGWGQLTESGKAHQYELGKFLRRRYRSFLGDIYSSGSIWVQSTDSDRTKMSARLQKAALYPSGKRRWREQWLSEPIHFELLSEDKLLLARISCPRYYELQHEVLTRDKELNPLTDLYDYLSSKTGMEIRTLDDVQSIYSTLKSEEEFGLTLPRWAHRVYPTTMYQLAAKSFILNAYNQEMQKLKAGYFLMRLLNDYTCKVNGLKDYEKRKMFLYVAHDSTIVNLLMALNLWESQVPQYNTMIIFELHKLPGDFAVKVLFKNTTANHFYHLTLPHCDTLCPLKKFIDLTKNITSKNLEKECSSKTWKFQVPELGSP